MIQINKKTVTIGIVVLLVVIGLVATFLALNQPQNSADNSQNQPSFTAITPNGEPISNSGGWQRVSPDGNDPVYAYSDTVDNVKISVSQQRLPESFQDNTEKEIAELAKGYSATKKLQAGATSYYIGNSAKGPQSVIFTKQNLLVLIKSDKAIDDTSWTEYISDLR